ncbi:TPA: acyltransferase [Enterobacter cloacae]|nr:acyltransferase [Enterobacter cloacae]
MNNKKIQSIHYLRGIAALMVAGFHFRAPLNALPYAPNLGNILFGSGAFGVDLFFIISGFIIAMSTERNSGILSFMSKRFFRIYPAFIFVFLIGSLTVYSNNSLSSLARSALLIHKDYNQVSPSFGYNILGPAWTLTYEIYFYSIFLIAMSFSHKYRCVLASLLIALPMAAVQLWFNGSVNLSGDASAVIPSGLVMHDYLRFASSPIMIEFIVGMAFYGMWKNSKIQLQKHHAILVFSACSVVFLYLYFLNINAGFGLQGFGFWSVILVLGCLCYEKSKKISTSRVLIFLGDISFSLYISHYLVKDILNTYNPDFWSTSRGIETFSISISLTFISTLIIHYGIEKPFLAIGRKVDIAIKSRNLNTFNGSAL